MKLPYRKGGSFFYQERVIRHPRIHLLFSILRGSIKKQISENLKGMVM